MQFREKPPVPSVRIPALERHPCAVVGCAAGSWVNVRHHGAVVWLCTLHANAYGRGELEPIEEEAK